ncbi:replication-relaxation family protein [Paenarthrobacter nitroguajacolicus]|uniref:replication-relaxation family protein n=1 Tax=Paenarthrobacter nitroguajacolicus TaxID=211146 RepID=UPI0015BDB6EB|nr:replication-relaxation family protein [Paenarthrobacter nitroguajacolicus]NWL35532.1 hypothetical protein [Paenarthrobacter nitroguajacolicus]
MTATDTQNTDSGVPNFLLDEEDDSITQMMPGTIQQPENSTEPESKTAENATIGADRTSDSATIGADSQAETAEYNAILAGDMDDFDDEEPPKPTPNAPVSAPKQTATAAEETVEAVESDAEPTAKKRKRKVNPAAPKYGRTALRPADYLLMALVRKCGFSTSKQIGIALNVATSTAHKRALGLKEIGLIGSDKVFGMTQLWYLTQKGYEVLDFMGITDHRISKRYHAGKGVPSKLEHTLAVNHVIAQLVGGKSDLLKLAPVELATGIDLLPFLVPEYYMNSEYSRATFDKRGKYKPVEIARDIREGATMDVRNGHLHASEVMHAYPALWTVVNKKVHASTTKESHPADLVIDLEHLRHDLDKPVSIGVEVELSAKQPVELKKILNSFWQNKTDHGFASLDVLAYLTPTPAISTAVKRAAKEVLENRDQRYLVRILELKDAAGNRFDGKAWTL